MTAPIKKDIIDNQKDITMQKILNSEIPHAQNIDISTGYFDVKGYGMLRNTLDKAATDKLFSMRLLLGKEAILPQEGPFEKYAKKYNESIAESSLKTNLDDTELSVRSRDDTTALIKLLQQENIHVRLGASRFNHSKCYILGNNSVFIGSSNLTAGGMTGNYELNAGLYQPGIAEQTRQWFDRMWSTAEDTKQQLIDVLQRSKFGAPAEPYEVYMKMLFERFRPLLEQVDPDTRENKTLTKFQQDAIHAAMFIVSEFGGVMIADATGLGKTNMGIEMVRQKVLKEGKKVLLVAPAQVLHSMWTEKLKEVDINIRETLTMESLGREDIINTLGKYRNIDLVLIDESQNFRSKGANRRTNLMKLMSIGKRKQVILLTATPINNSLMDLYYQISIISGGEDHYFYRHTGIPDLYKHMRDAANKDLAQGLEKIQQLLDFIMVRRTRSYIKEVYKDDKIGNKAIKFPTHDYSPIKYDLADLFGNIFKKILDDIGQLTMAPYGLGRYDKRLSEEEQEKYRAAGHLQVTLLLKRFESSVEAVRISLENKVNLYRYIKKVIDEGKILRVRDFNKIMTKWSSAESSKDPDLDTDEDEKMKFFLDAIAGIQKEEMGKNYNVKTLRDDIQKDMTILENLLDEVKKITVDTKIDRVIETILREQALYTFSKKVLIFTEYTATARYVTKKLREKFPQNVIECITGNTRQETRINYIRRFSPNANLLEDETLDSDEIDILVSTEVLSEGQNLQDCNYVINYDLPWNPMRIVQRTGRVDRLTSKYDVIHTRACYPDKELDGILKLMGKLLDKINVANEVIGVDSEILGETPNPKQFNGTAQRIEKLAGKGADELVKQLEQESDVMPSLSPINELGRFIKEKGIETVQDIPIGRRSGKTGQDKKMILAYLQEKPERRVYFVQYDFKTDTAWVSDDDSEAIRLVSCHKDTAIYLPMDTVGNQESFEMLLGIDPKARLAIKEKNDAVSTYVKDLQRNNRKKHDKNIEEISKLIFDAILEGKIIKDEGKKAINIVKSEYIQHWSGDLDSLLSEYRRDPDVVSLISGIKKMGAYIGIQQKTAPIKAKEQDARESLELKLIGAMFITPKDEKKSELDEFIPSSKLSKL